MAIEKRHQKRLNLALDAEVIYRRRSFQARIENLSVDGINIRTGALTAPRGTLVKVRFRLRGKEWLIPALVIYQDHDRIGAMFRAPQSDLHRQAALTPNACNGSRRRSPQPPHVIAETDTGSFLARHSG